MRLSSFRILSVFPLFLAVFLAGRAELAAQESVSAEPVRIVENGSDGETCWVHARGASGGGLAVMTAQRLLLTGSDVFYAIHSSVSRDGGKNWSPLTEQEAFRRIHWKEGTPNEMEAIFCDAVPAYHAATGKFLMTGHLAFYTNNRVSGKRFSLTEHLGPESAETYIWYSVFQPETETWAAPRFLTVPKMSQAANGGAGCAQRYDLPDGTILLPISSHTNSKENLAQVTMVRCAFDGENLFWLEEGTPLRIDVKRGFGEPSVIKYQDRYFLTLRNDQKGYVAASSDGLNYGQPVPWKWESGEEIGNYNTQQHWLSVGGKLYLVYTRRTPDNGHVFRNRAPLFIAEFDPETLALKRETERVAVPERGARLGNFGTTSISEDEGWVIVSEWMQSPRGGGKEGYEDCVSHGADGSIWLSRIRPEKSR